MSAALSAEVVRRARDAARASGRGVIAEIEQILDIDPLQLAQLVAASFGLEHFETAHMLALKPAFDVVPLAQALGRHCVVLRDATGEGHPLIAVIADPFDDDLQVWLETRARQPLSYRAASSADIHAFLGIHEESARAMDSVLNAVSTDAADGNAGQELSFASVSSEGSPAVRLVNSTLHDALKTGASDVHLESSPTGLTVKYRIDGVLDQIAEIRGRELAEQVISRLKVLAELDIAENRVPQDGSFRVAAAGRQIDLRVSVMPSIHGEDAVIRILDKRAMIEKTGSLTLDSLGFDAHSVDRLRDFVQAPYGMMLVTGPTGSGKTTTLYAAISVINSGKDKIVTIEDPVEYQLPGVLQIPVNEKKGLTFARGLRSILRHDPDKIMVGEIRDRETAEIAVQSALTGHLVLTTVHANNVFDVFGRFTHMGVDPYGFASSLNAIWAQRLLRVVCERCAVPYQPTGAELAQAGLDASTAAGFRFRKGRGCGECRGTGYRGRRAIAEILGLTDEIRELIIEKRPIRQVKEAARASGTRYLHDVALDLARSGDTTLEEVRRVTLHS